MKTITMSRICKRLNITNDRYLELFFENGSLYVEKLEKSLKNSVPKALHPAIDNGINRLKNSPVFWQWWSFETEATDRAFLRQTTNTTSHYNKMQGLRLRLPSDQVIKQITADCKTLKKASA